MEMSPKSANVAYVVALLMQLRRLVLTVNQVNLSGGQKARGTSIEYSWTWFQLLKCLPVSLARAVYSRASILLLDDVLSAGT